MWEGKLTVLDCRDWDIVRLECRAIGMMGD